MRVLQSITLLVVLIGCQQSSNAKQDSHFTKMRDYFLQSQSRMAEQELKELGSKFGLDEEICDEVLTLLERDIEATADLMSEMHRGSNTYDRDKQLCTRLRDSVWREIDKKLPQERRGAFESFKSKEVRTQGVADEVAISSLLVYLDNRLSLSEIQIRELRERYTKNWYSGFSRGHRYSHFAVPPSVFVVQLVSDAELGKVLSPTQLEVLALTRTEAWMRYDGSNSNFGRRPRDLVVEDAFEEIELVCNHLMDMKISEYQELVGADKEQVRKLERVKKLTISNVLEPFEELLKKVEVLKGRADPRVVIAAGSSWLDEMIQDGSMQSRCFQNEFWKSKIDEVFDAEQRKKIEARELTRRMAWVDQCVNATVGRLIQNGDAPNLKVGDAQYIELVEMIKTEIDHLKMVKNEIYDTRKERTGVVRHVVKIYRIKFLRILTEEQWRRVSKKIRYYRQHPDECLN